MNKLNLRKNAKLLAIFLSALLVCAGCGETEKQLKERQEVYTKKAEDRIMLFEKCMALAATNSRQGDDDVSDLVDSCDDFAYYTSNQLNQKAN